MSVLSAPSTTQPVTAETGGSMSHRQVLEALSGLLLAMFVAILSSTVVSNALPAIVTDLHGSQTGYTWVVVATLLAMTATTPIWGKLADLFSKKLLVQSALVIFSIGSLIAGFAPSMEVLIGARVVQGLGVGGLTALVQVVIASMVTPRERGRYSGYIGAVFAVATVSGPLIGGLIVDTPGLGWRWCFFVGLPVAVAAFVLLQKTLPFYEHFTTRSPDDEKLAARQADYLSRVAYITAEFGSTADALRGYEQGRDILIALRKAHPNVPHYQVSLASICRCLGIPAR